MDLKEEKLTNLTMYNVKAEFYFTRKKLDLKFFPNFLVEPKVEVPKPLADFQ